MVETAGEPEELPACDTWINRVEFRSTAEVKIPSDLWTKSRQDEPSR